MKTHHDERTRVLRERLPDLKGEFRDLAEDYLSLYERFEKVVIISDKYHAEAVENWRERHKMEAELRAMHATHTSNDSGFGAPGFNEPGRPGPSDRSARATGTNGAHDPLLERLHHRYGHDPDVSRLLQRFKKLDTRLNKIVSISDGYQAQLHELTARLEHIARTDILTGISNRRDMVERLDAEIMRTYRNNSPCTVLLLDIDHFKRVNDTYGHDVGDAVLVAVAGALKTVIRKSDSCARWGGEEFLILCPDTDLDRGVLVAEKCRAAVETMPVPSPARTRSGPATVTISIGVSEWLPDSATRQSPPEEPSWHKMVRDADDALYAAKNTGRNRVMSDIRNGNSGQT
jgi:diguanylate cyclase